MILDKSTGWVTPSGTIVEPDEIRMTDPHRRKYDSAMAEYLDTLQGGDEETGDVEWAEFVQRFGKRLLFTDGCGFVTCEKYPTEQDAIARFEIIDREYGEWLAREDEG